MFKNSDEHPRSITIGVPSPGKIDTFVDRWNILILYAVHKRYGEVHEEEAHHKILNLLNRKGYKETARMLALHNIYVYECAIDTFRTFTNALIYMT